MELPLVVIRPVALKDLDGLLSLSSQTSFGLTTLPHDRDVLAGRIEESLAGFRKRAKKPQGETYLFVMEDADSGKVVGTSGIVSKVGGFEPFYAYKTEVSIHESEMLKVRKEIGFLRLVTEHNGPCEIGSLFLSPEYRDRGNGRLLSLSRFLFMAENRKYFDPMVIAEMRGVIDENGRSPFWEALGKHFFEIDFPKADALVMKDKKFIADLMPTHPIYLPLLAKEAREVVGKVHAHTAPALQLLESEGFRHSGMVDIFEGGPIMRCPLEEIRSVRESIRTKVAKIAKNPIESNVFIVANTHRDFRACKATLAIHPGKGVEIGKETAAVLHVKTGDPVRIVPLRDSHPPAGKAK